MTVLVQAVPVHTVDLMDEDTEEDYELSRQQKILANNALIAKLGLLTSKPPPTPPKPRLKKHKATYDRDGYITSLPAPGSGKRHRLAAILMLRPRGYKREDYHQMAHLKLVPHPTSSRPRSEPESESEPEPVSESSGRRTSSQSSAYQDIPGPTCHQCKRRSYKLKMVCRSIQPDCRRAYCTSCLQRYTSITFESDARGFICPYCQGTCNCRQCLLKRGIRDVIRNTAGKVVQEVVENLEKDKIQPPFSCVRLVDRADDIVTIGPPVSDTETSKPPSRPRQYRRRNPPPGATDHRTRTTLSNVPPQIERLVDTDGETVGGATDEESDTSEPAPRQLFPPQVQALVYTPTESPSLPDPGLTLVNAPQWESLEWLPYWQDSANSFNAMEIDCPSECWPLPPIMTHHEEQPSEWPEGVSNLQILASAAHRSR